MTRNDGWTMYRFRGDQLLKEPLSRNKILRWCEENGVNPNEVPTDAMVCYDDEYVEIEVYDPSRAVTEHDGVRRKWIRVKYSSPIPEDVLEQP